MDYIFGEDYAGLFADDYNMFMESGNQVIIDFLSRYMTPVAGGAFYIYNNAEDPFGGDLIDLLIDYESDAGVSIVKYFTYLKSSWKLSGF